jgi:hypothetical protein
MNYRLPSVLFLASWLAACNGSSPTDTAASPGTQTPPSTAPSLNLSASPTSIASGGSSTLTWSSTNTTACTASGGWSGSKASAGSQTLTTITSTTTYTLACTGSGGSATQSATVTVSTDTAPPSVPGNVLATVVSATQINLSWSAATDNVGVTGYRIYRGGTLLTSVTGTAYAHTGLSPATSYTYTVAAYDAAGNASAQSTGATATTPAGGSSANPIDTLAPGHWYRVPNSKIRSVAFNWPAGVTYTRNGLDVSAVISVWNGGAYDTKRDKLIVWGGGHFAYGGNEIYAFNVNTLKWERINDPSIPVAEDAPYAQDGGPVARHTYNTLQYVASIDRFCAMSANSYFSSSGVGSQTDCFNFDSNKWERKADTLGSGYGTYSAYDSVTGHVFVKGVSSGCFLSEWDPLSNTWTQRSAQSGCYDIYYTAAFDSKRRTIVEAGDGAVNAWDTSKSGNISRTSVATSGPSAIYSANNPGFVYDPISDKFVGWNGGADVYTLDPATWAWARVAPAPTNTVIPTQPDSSGTFGRFRYIPSKNVFIVVNGVDEDVYIYKLSSGS